MGLAPQADRTRVAILYLRSVHRAGTVSRRIYPDHAKTCFPGLDALASAVDLPGLHHHGGRGNWLYFNIICKKNLFLFLSYVQIDPQRKSAANKSRLLLLVRPV